MIIFEHFFSLQIRARGFDYATLIRDFNLIQWFSANSIRTSEHPPPEELLELTDKYGIMVINESPTVAPKEVYQYVFTLTPPPPLPTLKVNGASPLIKLL